MGWEDIYEIKNKIDEASRKTSGELRDIRRDIGDSAKMQEQLLDAFNRMTKVLENLAEEVKALHNDLNPELDKPRKLPAPATGG